MCHYLFDKFSFVTHVKLINHPSGIFSLVEQVNHNFALPNLTTLELFDIEIDDTRITAVIAMVTRLAHLVMHNCSGNLDVRKGILKSVRNHHSRMLVVVDWDPNRRDKTWLAVNHHTRDQIVQIEHRAGRSQFDDIDRMYSEMVSDSSLYSQAIVKDITNSIARYLSKNGSWDRRLQARFGEAP